MLNKFTAKQLFFGGLGFPLVIGLITLTFFLKSNFALGAGEERVAGNKNAKIKLVEYSDFQCPFCKKFYPTFKRLLAEYGDKVSFEYKHYPLNFHPFAQKGAEASECAGDQGKFWQLHDKIFENQESLSLATLKQWAKDIGLNSGKFNSCLDSGKYADKVQADFREGQSLGVSGTPTVFINGEKIVGAQPYETFKAAIDKLLN